MPRSPSNRSGPTARARRGRGTNITRLPARIDRESGPARDVSLLVDGRPDSLPAEISSFIGCEREVAELARRIERKRLVTLIGPPGVGKTRLSLRVASQVRAEFIDGVWLVELGPLSEEALVAAAVARGVGLGNDATRSAVETTTQYLSHRHGLLVLDNCEHLLDSVVPLVGALLEACPALHVLATSREPLSLTGEVAWSVPPLSLPESSVMADAPGARPEAAVGGVLQSEAARLFVERAGTVRPGFELTARNAEAVAEICRRLDGIPLAIELAAARARALSPDQLAARLDDRFAILTGGSRASLPRHRTLRALVDWSQALLSEAERALLRRLSVFAGGWTLEAAEAVCDGDGGRRTEDENGLPPSSVLRPPSVLDGLASLVDKSLVLAEESDGTIRYRLLETIRQYAAEGLRAAGEVTMPRDRHRDWFLALAERAAPELFGPAQVAWLDRLEADHGNLRAALRWCLERPDAEAGLRFGAALWRFWEGRNHLSEGRAWLDQVLALAPSGATPTSACRARYAAGRMAFLQGDAHAARQFLEPCLARSQELGEAGLVAATLRQLGHLSRDRGDLATARSQYERGYQLFRELGDPQGLASSQLALGRLAIMEGALDAGRALVEESLRNYRACGDPTDIARVLPLLGGVAVDAGRLDDARAYFWEGLEIAASLRDRGRVAANLEGCAVLAAAEGRPVRAARLAAMAATIGATTGTVLAVDERRRLEARLAGVRRALGESGWAKAFQQARRTTIDEATTYALSSEADTKPASRAAEAAAEVGLSRRDCEVAALVARGLTNPQIAEALVISPRTAEWRVGRLRAKLGLASRTEIAVWALHHGLAPAPEP